MCERTGYPGYNLETDAIWLWLERDKDCKAELDKRAKEALADFDSLMMSTVSFEATIKRKVTQDWNEYDEDNSSVYWAFLNRAFQAVDWRQIADDWLYKVQKDMKD